MVDAIEVRDLAVELAGRRVLDGLTLSVRTGESLVIAGPSGCGKSVFLKTVLRLIEPVAGEIFIEGKNILRMTEREFRELRTRIGMVFQSPALFDSMTVWENVGFFLLNHTGMPVEEVRRRVAESLNDVGLAGIEEKMPEELSGGMKRRVSIARVLIGKPSIIFYDEPTTGLDPITSAHIAGLMREIHLRQRATTVTVTHDVQLAARVADRIALIGGGRIEESGTFEELKRASRNPLILSYLEAEEREAGNAKPSHA
jgi:phospholipid/cholesterol/gamma-HCH transport system ATP-binding protein